MTDIVCGFTDQRLGPAPTQAVVWSGGPPLVLAAKLCTGNIHEALVDDVSQSSVHVIAVVCTCFLDVNQ